MRVKNLLVSTTSITTIFRTSSLETTVHRVRPPSAHVVQKRWEKKKIKKMKPIVRRARAFTASHTWTTVWRERIRTGWTGGRRASGYTLRYRVPRRKRSDTSQAAVSHWRGFSGGRRDKPFTFPPPPPRYAHGTTVHVSTPRRHPSASPYRRRRRS
jgi:hypothetical protein